MNLIKDFLLQLALIATLLLLFQIFFAKRVETNKKFQIIELALFGLSILLCMSFPAYVNSDSSLDIRIVPLLLGTLYGGMGAGVVLSALIVIYRFYLGSDLGYYTTVLTLLFGVPIFIYFQKSFMNAAKSKRIRIALSLTCYYCLVGNIVVFSIRGFSFKVLQMQIIHLIFTIIVVWLFTSLNETIRELFRKNQLLQSETERLRVISDLTSVFAHEIRNPMQVTRGFLQLLNEPNLPDHKKQYIQYSIEELDRANGIINDLLTYGKPAGIENSRMNVASELRRVENIINIYALCNNVDIHTDYQNDCWIHANPQKLNQSLINILKNAVESMPTGGTIEITCYSHDKDYVEIRIKDQGIGMTHEQIDKLGIPFYSLKESGTGLGMMVSLQIIRNLGGRVHITSELEVGTQFSIYLPRVS